MLEVGPLARWSDVATPVRPVTGRHWLSPPFRYPSSRQPSLRSAFLRGGGMLGFTMFRSSSDERFSPCLLHRQSSGPCACMLKTSDLTAYRFGWSLSASLARYI